VPLLGIAGCGGSMWCWGLAPCQWDGLRGLSWQATGNIVAYYRDESGSHYHIAQVGDSFTSPRQLMM
jgi:hypothetical protein